MGLRTATGHARRRPVGNWRTGPIDKAEAHGYAGSSSDFGSRKQGARSSGSPLPVGNQAYRLRNEIMTETITVTEIARELGVTTRHVINLIHAGRLPGAEKINALPNAPYLVPRTSFDALLRARLEGRRSQITGKTREGD